MPGRTSGKRRALADEAIVRSLFTTHGRAMLAYATRMIQDRAAAEDIVQEALIRAWRNLDILELGENRVRAWLLTVIRNLSIDWHRAKASRPREVAEEPHLPMASKDHADAVIDTIAVAEALDKLSTEHRKVLLEIYYRGCSVAEAAQKLGVPAGTVKSRSYYALKALRPLVAGAGLVVGGAAL